MEPQLLMALAALIAASAGILASIVLPLIRKKTWAMEDVTPTERVRRSIGKLNKASEEVDAVLREIVQEMKMRQGAVENLKRKHEGLFKQEEDLRKRVEILKDTPMEVADYFQEIVASADKRKARRDVTMFIAGVILTTIVTVIINFFGG
jgi:chromosome segregation ATPase